jgi:hypothetical protein
MIPTRLRTSGSRRSTETGKLDGVSHLAHLSRLEARRERMPNQATYQHQATLVVDGLFPQLSLEVKEALVWLIVDALMSLDAIGDPDAIVK